MAKKFNFNTIKEMKTGPLVKAIFAIFGAIILIALGAMIGGKGGGAAILFGLAIAAGGGGGLGYYAYKTITDPKNEKTCNVNFWNEYKCVANPAGTDADYELNISECKAQTDAQYKGYAGVWITSNSSSTSNVDAFYVSGDKESITTTSDTSSSGGRLFARKAKAKGDDDKGVTVTGAISGCTVTKSLGTMTASSPSTSGLTLKLSGVTGFSDSDNVTLTYVKSGSSPGSPIIGSATIVTLKTTGTISQTLTTGSYTVTASATGASSVSATFTVA